MTWPWVCGLCIYGARNLKLSLRRMLRLEEQYLHVAARTRQRLQQARGFLGKVVDL